MIVSVFQQAELIDIDIRIKLVNDEHMHITWILQISLYGYCMVKISNQISLWFDLLKFVCERIKLNT